MKSNLKKVLLSIGLILLVLLMCSCDLLFSTQVKVINNTSYTLQFGYRSGYSTGGYALVGTIYAGNTRSFDMESGFYDFAIENYGTTVYYQKFGYDYNLTTGSTCVITAYNSVCYID